MRNVGPGEKGTGQQGDGTVQGLPLLSRGPLAWVWAPAKGRGLKRKSRGGRRKEGGAREREERRRGRREIEGGGGEGGRRRGRREREQEGKEGKEREESLADLISLAWRMPLHFIGSRGAVPNGAGGPGMLLAGPLPGSLADKCTLAQSTGVVLAVS